MHLLVTRRGGRLWRLKYQAHGVERKLSLGQYPTMTLAEARKARDAARSSASKGDDPAAAKRRERIAPKLAAGTTFGAIALEYIEKAEREGRSPATITKLHRARERLQPVVGHRPLNRHQALRAPGAAQEAGKEGQHGNGQANAVLREHDFARRLKTLHGLTPYEVICKA